MEPKCGKRRGHTRCTLNSPPLSIPTSGSPALEIGPLIIRLVGDKGVGDNLSIFYSLFHSIEKILSYQLSIGPNTSLVAKGALSHCQQSPSTTEANIEPQKKKKKNE